MQLASQIIRHSLRQPARWLALLILMGVAAWTTPAFAQTATGSNIVFLSTSEDTRQNYKGSNIVFNAWNAFKAQANAQDLSILDANTDNFNGAGIGIGSSIVSLGALSDPNTPLTSYIGSATKVIVVVSVFGQIAPARMTDLQAIMAGNPNVAVVAFIDGCSACNVGQNLTPFLALVNGIRPASWPTLAQGRNLNGNYAAILNPDSAYQATFSGNSPMYTQAYIGINNVPADYALYTLTPSGAAVPDPATDVVGLFIPQTASNGGQGACVFFTGDSSEFDPDVISAFAGSGATTAQYTNIARAFIQAATAPAPNGACAQAAAGQPTLSVTFADFNELTVGEASTITLTVSNSDEPQVVGSQGGTLTVTLPSNVTPSSSATVTTPAGATSTVNLTCTLSADGTSYACTFQQPLPDLDPGQSAVLKFQITPAEEFDDEDVAATITNVLNAKSGLAADQTNIKATLQFRAAPRAVPATPQPVPTLAELALIVLALLMAGGAAMSLRPQRARRADRR